ncbi:hypothetical protein [Zavarzinia compransoris]|uniref:Uncharacterized protein n=1 Tax=Zavarzinia compransoris TaxID=1264899 RepID=A0A317E6D4_9PROT|nr:hypothetical protein [Zavarzinia compransoris]PWR21776.1 hypothetical protein DKG75_07240 [Zavarzinia compransoris]TDP45425.1 hypothetical protein DES42_105129 [Zavarzinia compransoris]
MATTPFKVDRYRAARRDKTMPIVTIRSPRNGLLYINSVYNEVADKLPAILVLPVGPISSRP